MLNGCVTVGFKEGVPGTCPFVVEHSREVQARAAEELNSLPIGSAIAEILNDYGGLRDQTRSCSR